MSEEVVVIDDTNVDATGTLVHRIVYSPPQSWRGNTYCDGCGLNDDAVRNLVRSTAYGGTWMNAGHFQNQRNLTATLDFQGTSVAAKFILFFRVESPNARGSSNLTFFIDETERNLTPIRYEDFVDRFNSNNFTPQLRLFQASGLEPNVWHKLRIQWTHSGPRPPISVALDSIEFTTNANPGTSSSSPTSSGSPSNDVSQSRETDNGTKILMGILVPILVLLAVAIGLFVWRFRRKRRRQLESEKSSTYISGHQGFGQDYHTEPFTPISPYEGSSSVITAPVSLDFSSAQPPTYLDSLDSPHGSHLSHSGGYAPFVKSRR